MHERLVLGDLHRHAVAHEVRTAVAHVRQVQLVSEEPGNGRRGPHPAVFGMLHRKSMNLRVGGFGCGLERHDKGLGAGPLRTAPASVQFREHDLGRHRARELTRCGTTHTVGNHKERSARALTVRTHLGL